MINCQTLEERVAEHYSDLSGQLQKAADYVLANPLDIASRSLRAISQDTEVSPATFSRLSRALGYNSFEQMKDVSRRSVGRQVGSFAAKADRLRAAKLSGEAILERQSAACLRNIEAFVARTDEARLQEAANLLRDANRVVLLGALASTGVVEYMAYLGQYFAPNWSLAGRMGASLGAEMSRLKARDVLLLVTKSPYAERAVIAARVAKERGADVIVITDTHRCPALAHSTHGFTVPSDSPQFFSSYVTTLMAIETLIAMVVANSETGIAKAIDATEENNQKLGEYWSS